MTGSLKEKIIEITRFARSNGNQISYNTVVDILKDKEDLTESQILKAIGELSKGGIIIVPEDEEEYTVSETSPENFIPAEVNIGQRPVNVYNLMERLENHEINLSPSFQREGGLWSKEQQSRLIESLMLKIPIPAFYFNATDEDNWIVIDGLQRLTAFLNYLVGVPNGNQRIKKKFTGFQYLKDFNDHTFDELPRQYVRRIKETSVIAYTVEKGTPDEIVFNIFQRINTGGIVLNDQEIRQALYQGKATELMEKLAKSNEFLEATQNAVHTNRMQDREYVARFLAFTELDYRKEYRGNIDNYLIKAMKTVNTYEDAEIVRIEQGFKRVMTYCANIFGRYAFRRYNDEWHRGPINKALFEVWTTCFSECTEEVMQQIQDNKMAFLEKFRELQKNPEFIAALRSGEAYAAVRRIDMGRNLIKEFI